MIPLGHFLRHPIEPPPATTIHLKMGIYGIGHHYVPHVSNCQSSSNDGIAPFFGTFHKKSQICMNVCSYTTNGTNEKALKSLGFQCFFWKNPLFFVQTEQFVLRFDLFFVNKN
jgi:hypothetical protein